MDHSEGGRSTLEFDLCIIGAGPAGITIAREFANANVRVCLLDAGGLTIEREVKDLSRAEDVGRLPGSEDRHRVRAFGGSSNHWGGHCAPLEPDDFEKLDWIHHSGWPHGFDELRPFHVRAHDVLGLGEFDYDPESVGAKLGYKTFPFDPTKIKSTVSRYNRVRFAPTYGDELNNAPNIKVILHADVSDIQLEEAASDKVAHVLVKTIAGNEFHVAAKCFVVSSGAMENARILLMSNQQRPAGLGNHSDLVGRFYQEHLWHSSGCIVPRTERPDLKFYFNEWPLGDIGVRAHIAMPANMVRELRIPKYRSEISAVSVAFRTAEAIQLGVTMSDVVALISDPVGLGTVLACRSESIPTAYLLMNHVEQIPNPDSRVTLSNQKDAFGRPQPRLNWQLSRLDHEGVVRSQRAIAQEVGRSGFGRVRIELGEDDDTFLQRAFGVGHQMGTTRMDNDPALGVTDGNAKVHHTDNLYVAGSSLFPRCGWPNPTLTIVATSIRLADHLKTQFRADGLL